MTDTLFKQWAPRTLRLQSKMCKQWAPETVDIQVTQRHK